MGEIRARSADNKPVELSQTGVEVAVAPEAPPAVTALHANVPNPFNPSTRIAFDLATPGRVTLKIYGVDGRMITALVDEDRPAGRYSRIWNGTDVTGRGVASGTYVVRLVAPDRVETRRITLLK